MKALNKLIITSIAVVILSTCSTSPTGRKQVAMISKEEMDKMGTESFEEIKKQETISQNKAANDYVQCISKHITKNVSKDVHSGTWEVVVFESEQINAFALPGGKIGVYTGLMRVTENQDQLAAVIGHEVGHVIAEHSNERVSSSMMAQGGLSLLDMGLSIFGVQNSGLVVQGAGLGVKYGVLMPYGRKHESEADIIGQDLMAKSGFNPVGSVDLWHNMSKNTSAKVPEFLSTHPSSENRIRDLSRHLKVSAPMFHASTQRPQCKKPASV